MSRATLRQRARLVLAVVSLDGLRRRLDRTAAYNVRVAPQSMVQRVRHCRPPQGRSWRAEPAHEA